jgi:hypothetical protein
MSGTAFSNGMSAVLDMKCLIVNEWAVVMRSPPGIGWGPHHCYRCRLVNFVRALYVCVNGKSRRLTQLSDDLVV